MREYSFPVGGKEILCSSCSACTCAFTGLHESTKNSRWPRGPEADGGACLLQTVVSISCMLVQKELNAKMPSLPKERSHHLLSNAPRSFEFYKRKVFRKHPCWRLLFGFGVEYTQTSSPLMMPHVNLDRPLMNLSNMKWHFCVIPSSTYLSEYVEPIFHVVCEHQDICTGSNQAQWIQCQGHFAPFSQWFMLLLWFKKKIRVFHGSRQDG